MNHPAPSALAFPTGSEYFKYHGLWAPGVRTFRRLRFPAKAVFISLAFLMPLVLLAVLFVKGRIAELQTAALESQGTAYVSEVEALAAKVEALQSAALQEATQTGSRAAEALKAVGQQLEHVDQLDKTSGAALGTSAALAGVHDALARVAATSEGVMKVYASQAKLGRSVRELVTAAADGSGLTLDPEMDTYYLMDAAVLRLPHLIDGVSRMRSLSAAVAATGQGAEVAVVELNRLDALTEEQLAQTAVSLNKVIAEHPESKAALDLNPVIQLVDNLRNQATEAPGTGGKERAARLHTLGEQALSGLYAAQGAARGQLAELLIARERKGREGMITVLGAVLAALLVAAYLFHSFFIVMKGGLDEVRAHLRLMAEGDLTQRPVPWGSDEAADLMNSLAQTQESMRSIVGQVRDSAESIASASQQISQGAGDMSMRTERAASTLQQSSASMARIAETVSRTSGSASDATALAQDNSSVASEGGRIVETMVSTMEAINDSSGKIADIIGVIDGIAFQTNILALNAAVEAARAGEQGRGFAVVAGEVRSLAKRSSLAAREIKSLIDESVGKVEAGSAVVRRAGDTMSHIVANADRIRASLDTIAGGAREQAQGLQAIGGSVRQLDDATQQNAALGEETASAAASLNVQAQELVERVARFKLPAMA